MKVIEVKEQVRLPLSRCLELVLNGVRFRLFRAAITVAIISLAAAFLMTMLSESVISSRTADDIRRKVRPRQELLFWVNLMSAPISERDLLDRLASARPEGPRWREMKTWGGLDKERMGVLKGVSQECVDYLSFFAKLKEGQRRPLVGRDRDLGIFRKLSDAQAFSDFAAALQHSDSQMPHSPEEFRKTLHRWQETQKDTARILAGHREALAGMKELLGKRSTQEALAEADEAFRERIEKLGYVLSPQVLEGLQTQARMSADANRVAQLLTVKEMKTRLANERNVRDVTKVNARMLFKEVDSTGGAEWLRKQVQAIRKKTDELHKKLPELKKVEEKARQKMQEAEIAYVARQRAVDAAQSALKALRDQLTAAEEKVKVTKSLLEGIKTGVSLMVAKQQLETKKKALAELEKQVTALPESTTTSPSEEALLAARKDLQDAEELVRWNESEDALKEAETAATEAKAALAAAETKLKPQIEAAQEQFTAANKSTAEAKKTFDAAWKGYKDEAGQHVKGHKDRKADLDNALSDGKALFGTEAMLKSFDLPTERIVRAARQRLSENALAEVEAMVLQEDLQRGAGKLSSRTLWLIVVSFIVCIVGIANAMLMSVTERFREIATMKCLGATDGFIMINFIMESIMQGVAGGVIGTVLGLMLGALRSCAMYGWGALANIPPMEVLASMGISIVVSVVVSALAAVYPAWVAARLAPMEAMRIE